MPKIFPGRRKSGTTGGGFDYLWLVVRNGRQKSLPGWGVLRTGRGRCAVCGKATDKPRGQYSGRSGVIFARRKDTKTQHKMKKWFLLAAVAVLALPALAQQQEAFPSYIQVTGRSEMEVAPDEFYLSIVIDEKDSKGKISVEIGRASCRERV